MRRCHLRHMIRIVWFMLLLSGCDPLTRHKVLSTVFDGVPSLPHPEEFCQEAWEKKSTARLPEPKARAAAKPAENSVHLPYGEKRCNDCHDAEKKMEGGLLKPKNELCFMCHPDILSRAWAHGPAAVGDCLACHYPHDSNYPSLLVKERSTLCDKCHREQRLAAALHETVKAKGITCADCHDPHSGGSRSLMK